MPSDPTKETDDVSGVARAATDQASIRSDHLGQEEAGQEEAPAEEEPEAAPDSARTASPPPEVGDLATACVRYIASRYGVTLDFSPDTLSFLDQWLRDARADAGGRPEALDLAQSTAGAYLGEVMRRHFGGQWLAEGDRSEWRLCLSTVYCAFNPIGMAREALLLEPADGWNAHFELDPGERDAIDARLATLPEATADEYYAPSTRFDVLWIVVDALRAAMKSRGLDDVRFGPPDYSP